MFLMRPMPLPGESLSSWRQRAGVANGFRKFPRPAGFYRRVEPDRWPAEEETRWLQDEFLIDAAEIRAISLEAIGNNIAEEFGKTAKLRWVVPIANRKLGIPGSGCCPLCLSEDEVPYFRSAWRFAFLTHCPNHGCLLMDSCPSCSSRLWPSSVPNINQRALFDFRVCQACGSRLDRYVHKIDAWPSPSRALWGCATNSVIPLEIGQAASAREVFAGVWSICQLMLRKSSLHAWKHLPIGLVQKDLYSELFNGQGTVELLPTALRQHVVCAGYWLLTDWPNRFSEFAKASNLTRSHFSPTWRHHPNWLNEIVENSLSARKVGITREQVSDAIQSIRNSGETISKSAVRKTLGVSEAQAINEFIFQRRTGTTSELMTLCRKLEKKLAHIPTSRDQRSTLIRDYLIFLLSVLAGLQIEQICCMTEDEVAILISNALHDSPPNVPVQLLIAGRAKQLSELYSHAVRPELVENNQEQESWFVGRTGNALFGHTVRERIAKTMRASLPQELWNSADVFLTCLT